MENCCAFNTLLVTLWLMTGIARATEILEPFDAPRRVRVNNVSVVNDEGYPVPRSSVNITWDPVVGDVEHYEIVIVESQTGIAIYNNTIKLNACYDFVDQLLKHYTNYSVRVRAIFDVIPGPFSEYVMFLTDEGEPSLPRGFVFAGSTSDSVFVRWLPPLYHNGILSGYVLTWTSAVVGAGGSVDVSGNYGSVRLSHTQTSYAITGLEENTLYVCFLSAYNNKYGGYQQFLLTITEQANTPTATGQKNESDTLSHGTSEDGGVDEVPHTLSKRDSEGNNFNIKSGSVSTVSCVNIKSGSVSTSMPVSIISCSALLVVGVVHLCGL